METDPQIGIDADPREQQRSENDEIERDANAAEGKSAAQEELDLYSPDARKSVVVPGTDGTLSGTAFADWVDEDGNLKPEHQHEVVAEASELSPDDDPDEKTEPPEKPDASEKPVQPDNPQSPEGNPEPQEPPDE